VHNSPKAEGLFSKMTCKGVSGDLGHQTWDGRLRLEQRGKRGRREATGAAALPWPAARRLPV
jgi:hypothetical protein